MKKSIVLFLISFICLSQVARSQDTLRLFGNKQAKHTHTQKTYHKHERPASDIRTITGPGRKVGFLIGFTTDYSQLGENNTFGVGANIAIIANHSLAIGLVGKGFFSDAFPSTLSPTTKNNFSGGYGGILIEPILFPKSPIHLAFPVILGAGGITKNILYNYDYPYEYTQIEVDDAAAFLIAEPGVELEVNVARWLRFGVGCSYRFTTELESTSIETQIMDGFTGGISIKMGLF